MKKSFWLMLILVSCIFFTNSNLYAKKSYQQILNEKFLPLQEHPKYFYDKWYRKPVEKHKFSQLMKYKPNFGKKIFMKSWSFKDIKKYKKYFGKMIKAREFKIKAIDVEKKIAPYLKKEIDKLSYKNFTKFEFERWKDRFENWARSYFDTRNAGKINNKILVFDGEYGNFVKLAGKVFFIEEKFQEVVDVLLKYEPDKTEKSKK